MKDIINGLIERFRRQHVQARRYVALMLVLALLTTLFVNWQLHGVGISMTADYHCGYEEHQHTAACYEKVLTCGYEEGEPETPVTSSDSSADPVSAYSAAEPEELEEPVQTEPETIWVPHEHTDACYEEHRVLTCYQEEHEHTDDCFDEYGALICGEFEHIHDDSCYTTEYELVCGLDEGELVEEPNPAYQEMPASRPVVDLPPEPAETTPDEPVLHHHTDACYTEELVCTIPEHHHTVECLADTQADVETAEEWQAAANVALNGNWAEDLLTVAKSQLDYQQSDKNFKLDVEDQQVLRGYSRYGAWYGNPYGAWDVMFLSYCLHFAGVPQTVVPQRAGVMALHSDLRGSQWLTDADGSTARPGDIVIYNTLTTEQVAVDESSYGIALLDLDEDPDTAAQLTASEPQVDTRTVTTETVGVVSAVDPDAGTLTVISGNVDGKVAKVTLNASQVTTLVSVANAQQADYGVATPDYKVEDDAGAITTIKGLDALDHLTALTVQRKNGTEYEDTNVTTISEFLHSSLTVTDIPAKAIQDNDYCVHVKLPKSFDVLNDELISGKLEDTGNYDTCGSYRLLKGNDGCWYAVLRYDQNYIKQKEEAAAGADTSDAKVTSNIAFNFQWNQSEVTSSGFNQIEVNKDYALDITINPDETPDEDQKDDKNYDLNQSVKDPRYDGSDAYLDYTVTLVVKNEQAGPLTLADSMTLPTGVTAEYVENSLQLSMENGDTTLRITWEDDNGERKITLGSAGSPIAAGTYSICYTVKLKDVGETAVDGEVINNIRILDTPISDDAEESVKTDSLVITSQADPSDYELPSTGGAGTKLYTAGGGALMLAALVCGVCRKRRRERRAR